MPVPVPIPVLDLKAYNATTGMLQDKITRIISKPKQTWQEQVLIKLCCWMPIAQKQSMTPNFFYSMISLCVQICIYHIGNMTDFYWRTWMTTNVRQNLGSLKKNLMNLKFITWYYEYSRNVHTLQWCKSNQNRRSLHSP